MARYLGILLFCLWPLLWPIMAAAQHGSLFPSKTVGALFVQPKTVAAGSNASLFQASAVRGLLAPVPERQSGGLARPLATLSRSAANLLDLIALAEAGPAGYNAVQYGAEKRPPRLPSQMTLGEVFDWIDATPGQPHAIGRYQFIPSTLRRLVAILGYGRHTRFSPKVQDQLALVLLQEAGLEAFQARTLSQRSFMKNLATIWAGLPLPSGKSYYHGHAGNKATMSFARFEAGMERIF